MIRSSALLTAVAMAILVAGVAAANLALIYFSIAVSILAAVTLAVGVLLRRRELFGESGAAPQRDGRGWAAAEKARPVPARPAADGRVAADRGARREDTRRDGEQRGDLAARRKAGSGAARDTGPARWPASIAAKSTPATARRGGEQTTGGGRITRPPAGRGPAPREPARADQAGRERDDRDPAAREPAAREAAGREPVPTGSTGRGAGWPPRPGSVAGPGRPAEPGRGRAGAGRGQGPATARPDHEHGAPGRGRGERDRAAAASADRAQSPPGRDRDQEAPARRDREQAGRGRGEAAAGPWDRVVPPYVDDLGRRGQQREPERQPAGADEPDDAARTGEAVGPAAGSAWSAWSSTRAQDHGTGADAGEPGPDSADRDAAHEERAVMQATAGGAAGTETGAAGATGDREAEAGAQGGAAVDETADQAGPGGTAPGEAERPAGDGPGETPGSTAEAESEAEPGSTHHAADTSKAAGTADAGDAGESGAAGADPDGSAPPDDQVTVVPGVPRYHRRGCILIRFLSDGDLEISTRRAAEAAGSVPCKACQPDKPA